MSGRLMKQCSRCARTLPLNHFNKEGKSADGHNRTCRRCLKCYNYYRLIDHGYVLTRNDYLRNSLLKVCTKCGVEKVEDAFHKQTRRVDGTASACKICAMDRTLLRPKQRAPEQEKLSLKRVITVENNAAYKAHLQSKDCNRFPEVYVAVQASNHFLKPTVEKLHELHEGKVCELCAAMKCEAHHYDYLNPLSVIWLCTRCHAQVHRQGADKLDARELYRFHLRWNCNET